MSLQWLEQLQHRSRVRLTPAQRTQQLQDIALILQEMGNPQQHIHTIHIAGSKGKGSTAMYIAHTLVHMGYRCMSYHSPHVYHMTERLCIDGQPCSWHNWQQWLDEVYYHCQKFPAVDLGYFDVLTLMAFWAAYQLKVDYLILETGIGGRLDTTVLCHPVASIITPIEKEHCDILGHSLAEIAFEKAGIIKSQCPVFVSTQDPEAEQVLRQRAQLMDAPYYSLDDTVQLGAISWDRDSWHMQQNMWLSKQIFVSQPIAMMHNQQGANAALAWLCLYTLMPNTSSVLTAWQKAVATAQLPGRFERVCSQPLIIFDGSHTAHSFASTVHTWRQVCNIKQSILLFACALDKDWRAMMPFFTQFRYVIVTSNGQDHPQFWQACSQYDFITVQPDYSKAWNIACNMAKDGGLLVAGSFYLLGLLQPLLEKM